MAGYQRFVAYVYEYRKGKKDSSSGYVRVEARDRRCLIEVHLRCVGLEPGSRCRVYGFVRREGLMDGILIGSCVTGRERIECALETDAGDIGGMGKSLQELGGLLLISDAGGFWGTEWDDQPIRPENFREWKKTETEGSGENRNGISKGSGEKKQRAGRKGRRKSKRWCLARSAGRSEGVRQDHDGGGDSGGCIEGIGNRKSTSGSRSASARATATRSAVTTATGTTATRPAVTVSAGTTAARSAVTASAGTTTTGAISSTSGNTL